MNLPSFMLRHSVTVETRTGSGGYGDVYGDPVTVRGLLDDTRRLVRDINTGKQVVASSTFYTRIDQAPVFVLGSKVTSGTREMTVVAVTANDGGGLPTPDHLAVSLV